MTTLIENRPEDQQKTAEERAEAARVAAEARWAEPLARLEHRREAAQALFAAWCARSGMTWRSTQRPSVGDGPHIPGTVTRPDGSVVPVELRHSIQSLGGLVDPELASAHRHVTVYVLIGAADGAPGPHASAATEFLVMGPATHLEMLEASTHEYPDGFKFLQFKSGYRSTEIDTTVAKDPMHLRALLETAAAEAAQLPPVPQAAPAAAASVDRSTPRGRRADAAAKAAQARWSRPTSRHGVRRELANAVFAAWCARVGARWLPLDEELALGRRRVSGAVILPDGAAVSVHLVAPAGVNGTTAFQGEVQESKAVTVHVKLGADHLGTDSVENTSMYVLSPWRLWNIVKSQGLTVTSAGDEVGTLRISQRMFPSPALDKARVFDPAQLLDHLTTAAAEL